MSLLKSYHYSSHQGPFLKINEDSVECDVSTNLYLLIDAFGGQGIGDKICDFVKTEFRRFYHNLTDDPDSTLPFYYNPLYSIESNALVNATKRVSEHVWKQNQKENPRFSGGLSLTALSIDGLHAHLCSVGANLVIHYRDNNIHFLNAPEKELSFNFRHGVNPVLNAIGLTADPELSIRDFFLREGDKLIILSDGIYERLSWGDLKETITCYHYNDVIEVLTNLANDKGNRDNQSGIVLCF